MTDDALMKPVLFYRYGPPETLALREVPVPRPAPRDIRVRVHATTVGLTDTATLPAHPFFAHAVTGLLRPKIRALGMVSRGWSTGRAMA